MNGIFKDKKRNLIAACFTALYTIKCILDVEFKVSYFQNFRYAISFLFVYLAPIITPALVLVFLLTLKKEYRLKRWLLPIAFGVKAVSALISLCFSFSTIGLVVSMPKYTLILLCSCLIFFAFVFMFIGTFNSKYINFLKYGALSCAVLYFVTLIIDFINVGGFEYLQSVPNGYSAINFSALISSLAIILFYIGIFILATNKKNTELV